MAKNARISVCAPLCCKKKCCASGFCTGGRGAGGSRSKNLLEGAMKQMLVQGDALRLLDEAREPGISSTRNPKTRTVSTCWINSWGSFPEDWSHKRAPSGNAKSLVGTCLATGGRIFVTGGDTVSRCVLRFCACFCLISQGIQSWFERTPEARNILQ